jgi:hypothetical protein
VIHLNDSISFLFAPCPAAGTLIDAKDYSIFVVRRSGGGGGEFLRLRVQEFEGQRDDSLHREEPSGQKGSVMTVAFELDGQER